MRIIIEFNMDGAAGADDPTTELRTAFEMVAENVVVGNYGPGIVRDVNGARFAEWTRED